MCMTDLMNQKYGSFTAKDTIKNFVSVMESGDNHILVYDYAANMMYVASGALINSEYIEGYNNVFLQLNMDEMFSMQAPQIEVKE